MRSRIARTVCGQPKASLIAGFSSCDICSRKSTCLSARSIVSIVASGFIAGI